MSETTPQEPLESGGQGDSSLDLHAHAQVPELVAPEAYPEPTRDRWAHRRVEPRGLALAWTLYLLAATIASFGPAAALGVLDPLSGRYAARVLLVLVATGVGLLWPMMRLCQERPARGGIFAVGQDLTVMIIPTQAVVWPLVFLAMWPVSVVAAMGAVLLSWTVLFGGLLAIALGRGERAEAAPGVRLFWMAVCAVVLFGGALSGLVLPGTEPGSSAERWRAMFSPLTALPEIARERYASGQAAQVMPEHWAGCGVALGVGLGIWLAAGAYQGGIGGGVGGGKGNPKAGLNEAGSGRELISGETDAGSAR